MILARDIWGKVNKDFETPEEAALALSVLADFVDQNKELSSDRIVRCIVFVANGDLTRLEKAIDLAKEDYRDLIVWAEYNEKNERVRDLTNPF
jgi:uncharacterized protein YbaA (DUF1428 family)